MANRTIDKDNNEENRAAYKTAKNDAKKNLAITKLRINDCLFKDMDTTERQKKVLKMTKERDKNSKELRRLSVKDE